VKTSGRRLGEAAGRVLAPWWSTSWWATGPQDRLEPDSW
jgi:hypothetical protein